MSAILEFQRAAIAALEGSSGLMGLVSGVYDNVPQNVAAPYVYFGDVQAQEKQSLASKVQIFQLEVFLVSESLGKKQLYQVAAQVEVVLTGASFSLMGGYVHFGTRLLRSDYEQQSDSKTSICRQLFEVRLGLA